MPSLVVVEAHPAFNAVVGIWFFFFLLLYIGAMEDNGYCYA